MRTKLCFWAAAYAMMLMGCDVKDPIYETFHPDHGMIVLSVDWSATNIATPPAEGYTVTAGDYSALLTGSVNTLDYLFTPGEYTMYIHNTAENVSVDGTRVRIFSNSEGYLVTDPGWLYTCVLPVTVERDTDHAITAPMEQQIRELTFVIEPTGGTIEQIATITGTLTGIASVFDAATGTHSEESRIVFNFARDTDGDYKSTVRLLGIANPTLPLTITATYTNGIPPTQFESYDLTSLLAGFNDDKATPLTLAAQILETPTEAGFISTITPWTTTEHEEVIAE